MDTSPTFQIERALYERGVHAIAGVDEAGRGPLAGPVVASAVILPKQIDAYLMGGVKDSKQLSEAAREQFYQAITQNAVEFSVAHATAKEIDTINIRQASLLAMKRALENLSSSPDYVLVDGRDYPQVDFRGEAVVKGDRKSITIGAASILAKVVRDRWMAALHLRYPQYGLAYHKGYPTKYHRAAVEIFGPCREHRTTFQGATSSRQEANRTMLDWFNSIQHVRSENEAQALLEKIEQLAGALSETEQYYLRQTLQFRLQDLSKELRKRRPAKTDIGNRYENIAASLLESKGYAVWERNYHAKTGEIDLIANRGSLIVFAEVKARRSETFGLPHESLTQAKKKKIVQTADRYLYQRGLMEGWDIRYDLISILDKKNEAMQVEHYEDAFRTDEL